MNKNVVWSNPPLVRNVLMIRFGEPLAGFILTLQTFIYIHRHIYTYIYIYIYIKELGHLTELVYIYIQVLLNATTSVT